MYFAKLLLRSLTLLILSTTIAHASNISSIPMKIGVLTDDPPASYVTSSGIMNGIGIDFVKEISARLPVKTTFVTFENRKDAVNAMKNNDIQLLVGSFEEDPSLVKYNVTNSQPYFIDQISIVSKKYELSIWEILALVFNKLFLFTLALSFVVGIFFTFLLYHAEKNSHPHLKGCSRFEKISYCFFTIFSCFFRDLLYDPVTTFGRTLFGIWILISVFAVTVLSAIITSSVLYLMDKGSEILYHTNDLKNTNVAVIYGHPRLENMIEKAGANPVVFETINDAFNGLFSKKVEFMAIGKTNLSKFLEQNYSYAEEITTSKISLGYETWVLFGNEYYGQIIMNEPLLKYVNKNLNIYRNDFTMYNICERYIEHPELCVF